MCGWRLANLNLAAEPIYGHTNFRKTARRVGIPGLLARLSPERMSRLLTASERPGTVNY
jgi:hypothetical protein